MILSLILTYILISNYLILVPHWWLLFLWLWILILTILVHEIFLLLLLYLGINHFIHCSVDLKLTVRCILLLLLGPLLWFLLDLVQIRSFKSIQELITWKNHVANFLLSHVFKQILHVGTLMDSWRNFERLLWAGFWSFFKRKVVLVAEWCCLPIMKRLHKVSIYLLHFRSEYLI